MGTDKEIIVPINIQALEEKYKELLPLLDSFCMEITHQINRLLEESNITLGFPIQHRLKTWESLSEKIQRIPRLYNLLEIQDLVGLRIILLFKRDIDKVTQIIHKNFLILREYNTFDRLKEDQFGYASLHLIAKLKEDWLSVPTFTNMRGLIAEIQIRTLAQHIWAESSHKLQYKQEKNIPPTVRRSIYRVSALLETVDLEFERVLEERENYRSQIVGMHPQSDDERLNVDLVETLLDSKLPDTNKSLNEDYGVLLNNLDYFGIKTKQQLSELIEKHLLQIIDVDKNKAEELVKSHNTGQTILPQYTISRARKNVYFSHIGLVRLALRYEYGEKAVEYFEKQDDHDNNSLKEISNE